MKRPASFCLSAVAVLGAAVSLSSCGSGQASANIGPNGRPAVLRYCLTTSMEDPNSAARRLDRISDYLSKTLHVRIEGVRTTAYGAVIEAFRAEKIDVASISPFSYIIATEKTPIEAIAMRGSKGGTPESYTGVLVVAGNSPIHSVDDLIKHAKELTISFVDPDSTSGFLVQNAFFQSRGLEAQRDFKKVVFSMNHPASLMAVKAGKVDVAAAMQRLVNHYISTGKLASSDVRVIWVSPPIPNQPLAVRKSLPAAFKEEIRRAFIEMPDKDPQAWADLVPKAYKGMMGNTVYVPANDAMFDGLRNMARNVKNVSLLDR